jgi:crotonobetainyl-CoA:carnitine CoA-transferase CaiB-like acyl-CoA transferase
MPEMSSGALPLTGVRVLEYAQYVAGPFAGMLLADLGADVVKVEPPHGDAWRHYEPFAPGESRYFYALNRNKRSVVLNLKDEADRGSSQDLIRDADVVLHNVPEPRATEFKLDRESVHAVNPDAVWCCVSALGSDGPDGDVTAFDLVAQALSGLLFANAHPGDPVPQRAGGIAMADFTAGLLATIAVLGGLVGRGQGAPPALEVSLLGAALAVQAQRFVSVAGVDPEPPAGGSRHATGDDLARHGQEMRAALELEPYYRSYAASDGFFVLACLHERQRRAAAAVVGLDDPWAGNPQAPPAGEAERTRRLEIAAEFEHRLFARPVEEWVARFRAAGVPAAPVQMLSGRYDDEQVKANGLVQTVEQSGVGEVRLLGSPFKVNGVTTPARRSAPGLGEHTAEVLRARQESHA